MPVTRRPVARSAAHAAQLAASAYGLAEHLPCEAAEQIAAAVLGYSDDRCFVVQRIVREMWETMITDQEQFWRHLHVQLALELFDQRCVPVSLPERTVTKSPDLICPWPDMVELRLSVPVRKVA